MQYDNKKRKKKNVHSTGRQKVNKVYLVKSFIKVVRAEQEGSITIACGNSGFKGFVKNI